MNICRITVSSMLYFSIPVIYALVWATGTDCYSRTSYGSKKKEHHTWPIARVYEYHTTRLACDTKSSTCIAGFSYWKAGRQDYRADDRADPVSYGLYIRSMAVILLAVI